MTGRAGLATVPIDRRDALHTDAGRGGRIDELGNPVEFTTKQPAELVIALTGSSSPGRVLDQTQAGARYA
jgi:hypothetical protein